MLRRPSNLDVGEKAGLVDVKFPSRRKGQRCWCPRWVVMVKLVESGVHPKCYAKVDIYRDEVSWKRGRHPGRVFLEYVRTIKRIPSSTHKYAFQVDGTCPLSFSGHSETESQEWMTMLRGIFTPKMTSVTYREDMFEVSVIDNPSSNEQDLNGDYILTVQTTQVLLKPTREGQRCYQWAIDDLQKIHVDNLVDLKDRDKILDIVPRHPSDGQGIMLLRFYSLKARDIHNTIWSQIKSLVNENGSSSADITPIASLPNAAGGERTEDDPDDPYSRIINTSTQGDTNDIDDNRECSPNTVNNCTEDDPNDPYSRIVSKQPKGDSNQHVEGTEKGLYTVNRNSNEPPPLPPTSLRYAAPPLPDKDRTSSNMSTDSGFVSPTGIHPSMLEKRTMWVQHDSLDSGVSITSGRGSVSGRGQQGDEGRQGDDPDYDDVDDILSPIEPYQKDPFNIAWTLSKSQEQDTTPKTLGFRNRIRSEPNFMSASRRMNVYNSDSLTKSNHAVGIAPPLPPRQGTSLKEELNNDTSETDLNSEETYMDRISIFDPEKDSELRVSPTFHIGSWEGDIYDNSEYIQRGLNRSINHSDLEGSFECISFGVTDSEGENAGNSLDSTGNSCENKNTLCEHSGYLDMNGRTFKAIKTAPESIYMSMSMTWPIK